MKDSLVLKALQHFHFSIMLLGHLELLHETTEDNNLECSLTKRIFLNGRSSLKLKSFHICPTGNSRVN